jgi:hypothetical protein
MNRRSILGLSATAALGLALLPGGAVAQQTRNMDGVKAASKAFYAALPDERETRIFCRSRSATSFYTKS